MRKYIFIVTAFLAVISLLSSCKKDETKATLETGSSAAPAIASVPNLNLLWIHSADTLFFTGTAANPGFQGNIVYYLEADSTGKGFRSPIIIASGSNDNVFKITVTALNALLTSKFPADANISLDIRIRAQFPVNGTGAPVNLNSATQTVAGATFGLPRLDIISGGTVIGTVRSALGDGKYIGYVNLAAATTFKLKDPNKNTIFGANGATALARNGNDLTNAMNGATVLTGWTQVKVDTIAKNYTVKQFKVAVIGAFTNWGTPTNGVPGEYFMDYNLTFGYWTITLDLPAGQLKFRKDSNWGWSDTGGNWGPTANTDVASTGSTTVSLPVEGANINILTPGNYTITFKTDPTNDTNGTASFTRN